MFKLKCGVQNYSWGKKGCDSIVARIYEHNGGTIDPNLSYAEYWMGSHPNCPSKLQIKTEEMFLLDYLKNSSNTEGLKFLFKVLSIKDPLSIQIHPDKVYAEFLAKDEPEHYKDPNHKPEMAIAISDEFKLLYGFLPIDSALEIMTNLKEIFTKHANDNLHSTLSNFLNYKTKSCYLQLIIEFLNISNEIIRNLIDDLLVKDITNIGLLYSKFGYDKGILVSLLMNVYTLKKGDTIFIRPNVPHAYIEGDCLECMANSDNVIRLGLTPKYVDIKNFIKIAELNFTEMTVEGITSCSHSKAEGLVKYKDDSYDDFSLTHIQMQAGGKLEVEIDKQSIVFILQGNIRFDDFDLNGKQFDTFYIEKGNRLKIVAMENDSMMFIAN